MEAPGISPAVGTAGSSDQEGKKKRGRPPKASTEKVNAASTTTAIAGNSSVPPAAGQHDAAVQQQPTAGTPTTVQQPSDAMSLPQGPQQHPQEQHPQQPQPPQQQEPTHSSQAVQQQQQQLVQDPEQQQQQQYDKPAKRRGRPPGAKNKDTLAKAGTAGPLLTFVLHIEPGEDVCSKLQQLAESRSCSLTVLAASGTLSSATLMQHGGIEGNENVAVALTGRYTILSISGAVLQADALPAAASAQQGTEDQTSTDQQHQHFLAASLASSSGGVVGGSVAGPLIAASPVLLVLGLFGHQHK